MDTIKKIQRRPTLTVEDLFSELDIATTKVHRLHLQVESYAKHKALNQFYDEIQELADDLIEQYQGASETILKFPENAIIPNLKTQEDGVIYLRKLYDMVNQVQGTIPYSEIVNKLDEVKSLIDSVKYKLLFLKG